jgi:hypothetical protein
MRSRGNLDFKTTLLNLFFAPYRVIEWMRDYIKCLSKGLEYTNIQHNTLENDIVDYVNFDSQRLSLQTFLNYKFDPKLKNIIVEDYNITKFRFSIGNYITDNLNLTGWVSEYDFVPNQLGSYVTDLTNLTGWVYEDNGYDNVAGKNYVTDLVNLNGWVAEDAKYISYSILVPDYIYDNVDDTYFENMRQNIDRFVNPTWTYNFLRYEV